MASHSHSGYGSSQGCFEARVKQQIPRYFPDGKNHPNHNLPGDDCHMLDGWINQSAWGSTRLKSSRPSSPHEQPWQVLLTAPPHETQTNTEDQSAKPFELVRFHPEPSAHLPRPSSWRIRWAAGSFFGGKGAQEMPLGSGGTSKNVYSLYSIIQ